MATNVDERIVAAKFDASDFEKGVDKTIKKLDELKKELNIKEASKNVEEFAKKTEASTESMGKSLDKLTERFTSFVGMVKQKILSGLADEVAGVFLKMEQSVKSFIKGISSDQVSAGMSKYEQMLSSVRTMMAAGESEDSAYAAIGQLRDYSDQTSYSLSQMTDALSKLRAAGVDLDTAQKSVEGIANACANAGINATDAQRAFFNLSQAYSSGVLKYTDYRSLELLNMTTEKFKENILEAAVSAGTLKKTSEGVYQTINKNNKKVTAGKKVTKQNLQDMLRYNFVTSDVMNELFGGTFFFDESKFKEYKKKYATLDEAIAAAKKDYGETAVNAYLAAREARSFTDVINTLKDVVSTGWSTTFEHLFGKLEEAKDFFTQLAEGELADVVYKIGEYRNAILGFWDDGVGDTGGGAVFRQTILNISDALGELLKTFLQILPGFDELYKTEEKIEKEGQPALQSLGDKLFMLSMRIRDFSVKIKEAAENFNKFMNEKELDGGKTSRIEKLRQIFTNLSAVFGIFAKVVSIAFSAISRAFYVLSPIFDGFLQLLSKITEPLVALKNNSDVFKDVEHSIDNIFTILEPVAKVLGDIIGFLGEIGAFIAQMAIDTVTTNIEFFSDALGLLLELFGVNSAQMKDGEGVLANIRKDFEGIKDACKTGLTAVKDFFGALLGDIRKLLGLEKEATEGQDDQNGGVFSGLINFFNTNQFIQDAKKWVDQAIIDVGNFVKSIPERVMQFGANIYDTLRGLFFTEQTRYNGSQLETKEVLTPLGEWVVKAADDIKNWFKDLPNKILNLVGDVGNWINDVFNSWFGKRAVSGEKSKQKGGTAVSTDDVLISRFEEFIYNTKNNIIAWFNDLPNKIQKAFKSVGDFASKLLKAIDDFLFGKKVTKTIKQIDPLTGNTEFKKITVRYKTGFSKWLNGVIRDIKKFINKIPEYVKAGIKGAGDIISTVIGALFGKPDDKDVTKEDVEKRIEKPFLGIDLTSVLDTIKDIGTTLLNQIARIFTGTDDVEANTEWFANIVANGIEWIRTKAKTALDWVLEFIVTIPTKIANFFKGENADNQEQGPIGTAISKFGSTIGGFIADIPKNIVTFFTNAIEGLGTLWDKLYKSIIGETEETTKKSQEYAENEFGHPVSYSHRQTKSKWDEFVESLGKLISTAFEKLPTWVAQGIHVAVEKVNELFNQLTKWLQGENIAKEMEQAAKEATKEANDGAKKVAEDAVKSTQEGVTDTVEKTGEEGENPLLNAVKGIGQSLYNVITTTIPAFLSEAWKWVVHKGGEVWNAITGLFSGYEDSDFKKTVDDIGDKISKALLNLPGTISNAFSKVTEAIKKLFKKEDPVDLSFLPEEEKKHVQEYIDSLKRDGHGKNGGFGLVEAFSSIFDSIFGDDGFLSGDVGQKIINFFTKTVPNWIGRAIGSLINKIPEIYKSFSDGMLTTAEAEGKKTEKEADKEAETGEKAAVRISNAFSGILETFMKGLDNGTLQSTAIAIVKLIAVVEVLKAIRDIISTINVTKNLSERAEATNGFTATMKRIATALIAAFALVAYITTLPDDKRKDAMEVIKDLTELFKLLVTLTTVGKGLDTVSNVAEVFGDVKKVQAGSWDAINGLANENKKNASKMGKIKDAGASAFSSILTTLGLTTAGEIAQQGLEDIVGSIVDVFERLSNGLKTVSQYISDTVGILLKIKTDIRSAIEVAGDAFVLVQRITEIGKFSDSITTIQEFMPSLTGALDLFKNSVSGRWVKAKEITESIQSLTGMIDQMRLFAAFTKEDAFEQFKYGLASLGSALSLYTLEGIATAGSNTGIAGAVAILKDILGSDELTGLAAQLDTDKFPDARGMYGAAEKIVILAGAIASISKASAGIESDASTNLQKLFDAVSGLTIPTDQAKINELAGKFGTLGNALGTFATDTQGLTEDKLKSVKIAIDIMMDLTQSLKGTGQSFLEKVFEGDEGLDEFGTKLSLFGTKLKQFFDAVGGSDAETYNTENIETALTALRTIAVAYRDLNEKELLFKTDWTNLGSGLEDFGTTLSKFIQEIRLVTLTDDQNVKIRRILDMVHTLAEVAVLGFGNNANTELGELAKQLNPANPDGIGSAMFAFYQSMSSLEVNDNAITVFESFAKTLSALATIASEGLSARSGGIAYGKQLFDDLAGAFGAFNTQFDEMKQFFVNVKEFDSEGIAIAVDLFKSLSDFGQALYYFSTANVDRGLNNLKWFDWADLVDILSTNLYTVFENYKESFTPLGEIVAKALYEGMQTAFDDPDLNLQPTITPVLNLDVAKEQLRQFFGMDEFGNVNWGKMAENTKNINAQTESKSKTLDDIYATIGEVTAAVDSLKESQATVDQITSAFAKLNMYINKNVLVGEIAPDIDAKIGEYIALLNLGVTTP